VLTTYLSGLVIGSTLYARFGHRIRDTWGLFGLLISAAGLIALLEIAGLSLWQLRIQFEAGRLAFAATGSEFARMCAQFLVAAIGVVFLPTVLLGAAFPAVLRLAAGAERAGRYVGAVLALNTAGGITGTLLTGFLLVPTLGLVRTISMLAIAAAALGCAFGFSRKPDAAMGNLHSRNDRHRGRHPHAARPLGKTPSHDARRRRPYLLPGKPGCHGCCGAAASG
jgi:spermidine synthase